MDREQLLNTIADVAPGLVTVYNIQTYDYIYVNKAITKILGYTPEDFINGGVDFTSNLVHPEDIDLIRNKNTIAVKLANSNSNEDLSNEPFVSFEYRMKHKDGHWVWLQTEGSVFSRDNNGNIECILNISLNITERKRKENQLEELKKDFEFRLARQTKELSEREKMFRNLIEVVEDYAIFHLDPEGKVMSWNEGIGHILGYSAEEVIGQPIRIFFTEEGQKKGEHLQELEQALLKGTAVHEGIRMRKDGTTFFAVATTTAIYDEDGSLQGFSKIMRDVTELKEAEETIRYHALHDTLTGLSNRNALDEHFQIAKSNAVRNGNKVALIFLDLDRFKTINDTLGHGVGDLILKEMAHRLKKAVRKADTVARLGGDEFIILISGVNNAQAVARAADKILQSITPITRVHDQSLHVTASMGIAMLPDDGQDIYTLLKNADTALYRAKDTGRNRYQFYDYSMNMQSVSQLSLEQDLRTAVTKKELYLEYQPFIDIRTGKVAGVEALARWNHPQLGLILPFNFISLAEETGMIVPIGKWILDTVCKEGKKLLRSGYDLKMTVNLSGRQFAETELINTVKNSLRSTQLDPKNLEIEITESIAMENIARTTNKLNSLKASGVSIAIDDFGTGYSSLSYLKKFPVQKLKIDKSFVKHSITDPQDSTIIRAIISMGQSLGLSVCAEGVENESQLALLKAMGCDYAQGYLISKPLTVEKLIDWLEARELAISPSN